MKRLKTVSEEDAIRHWQKVENLPDNSKRLHCILDPLPLDLVWYLAEIEEGDLEKLYIISSDDWLYDWKLCVDSFKLLEAVERLKDENLDNKRVQDIRAKVKVFRENIDAIDKRFIMVAPTLNGNYTFLEGNRRAVALQFLGKLVGTQVYLGVSEGTKDYVWTRYAEGVPLEKE